MLETKFDHLFPVRDVVDYIKNCKSSFQGSEYCTIDQMLEQFWADVNFVNIANKPAKYA